MNEAFQIILIELVFVLLIGGGFLMFRAHKKKEALRNQIKALFKKFSKEAPSRKEEFSSFLKELRLTESQSAERAERLVEAEKNCIKAFASAQLTQAKDDVAFFNDVVYELSAVYTEVMTMARDESKEVVSPVVSDLETFPELLQGDEADGELGEDDDIEVSLDLDDLDNLTKLEEPEPEPEPCLLYTSPSPRD